MRSVLIIAIIFIVAGCKAGNSVAQKNKTSLVLEQQAEININAPVVIYKTQKDYSDLVPITLSDNGKNIISYPDPKDLVSDGGFQKPTKLKDGYLLDNRGVSRNTAFINLSYEVYSKLKEAPTLAELNEMIVDRDPFIALYNCGSRNQYQDMVQELNKLIKQNQFGGKFKDLLK